MRHLMPGLLAAVLAASPVIGHGQTNPLPVGQRMTLVSLGSHQVTGQKPTLTLTRADGSLTAEGDSGCNSFRGVAQVSGANFTLRDMIGTQRACADPARMKAEQDFLSALESVNRWRMDGKALVLEGGKGVLRFEPAS